jgi:hypothetical protein
MSETETYNWKLSPGGGFIRQRHGDAIGPMPREIIEYVAKLEAENERLRAAVENARTFVLYGVTHSDTSRRLLREMDAALDKQEGEG